MLSSHDVLEVVVPAEPAEGQGIRMSVAERILLLQILPKEGTLTTLRLVRAFREDLSFSVEEHEVLKFRDANGRIEWDALDAPVKYIRVPDPVLKIALDAFKALDTAGKLNLDMLPIYERFLEKVVV